MNKLFLKLVLLPSGLWRGMGADIPQLEAILEAKLKVDDRKPLSFGRPQRQNKPRKYGSFMNMFISFCMGLLYLLPLSLIPNRIISLTLFFSMNIVMLSFMLITDFSTVMFDTKDKFVILPRPVNDKTIFLSRTLHIFIYLFRIILPMALPAWIFLGFAEGALSVLLFPLPLLLMVFLVLFLVIGVYMLILRLAGAEKFKDIISYFQIGFTVLIFMFSYFTPRVFESQLFRVPDPANFGWMKFLPSYWLALCWSWIGSPVILPHTQWMSALAIVLPIVFVWFTAKFLAPSFAKSIGAMDVIEAAPASNKVRKGKAGSFYKKLSSLFNKDGASQAGFNMAWVQTGRSRTFKMRVYPMFAYAPVFFVYTLISNRDVSLADTWKNMVSKPYYLQLLYLSIITVMQALNYLSFTDQYKAAWVYYAAPLDKPGRVMAGAFKAVWIKYFMPFFTIITIFILWAWGLNVWMDVLLAMVNMLLFSVVMMRISLRNFPFSIMEQMNNSLGRVLKTLSTLLIPGLLGIAHYLTVAAYNMLWLKILFFALSSILLWLVWDSYSNTSWAAMRKLEEEA